jgi:hypothetical protein
VVSGDDVAIIRMIVCIVRLVEMDGVVIKG